MRERALAGPVLIISKTNAESTVHRRARMDYIGVKKLRRDGTVAGEHRFLGLFTSAAYAEPAQDIPILRQKLVDIIELAGAAEGSHDYKEIITIFSSLPKEELFLASAEEIAKDIRTILIRYNTSEVFVSVRRDALGRGVSIMVVMPRTRFSGTFRREFEGVLVQRYKAEILNYHLAMGAGDQARLHFYLGGPPDHLAEIEWPDLKATVTSLTRSWLDEVRDLLSEVRPAEEATRMARHYANAFVPEYKAATEAASAVRDIMELEAMKAEGRMESVLFFDDTTHGGKFDLKVYIREHRIILSDFMPVLENCGLRVIAVSLFELREGSGEAESSVYSFDVQTSAGDRIDVDALGGVLSEAILAVRAGDATNDSFNRLVRRAGMAWREVEVLRAFAHYAFQIGAVPSRHVLRAALRDHPRIGLLFFRLFEARFDPEGGDSRGEREAKVAELRERISDEMVGVTSLAYDRALRAYQTVIEGTIRTNYYRGGGRTPTVRSGGVPYISFKFESERLQAVSRSRLMYEVWVRSSRMEGIHLRGAAVARGGIRHSDRPDDFRTEVMGLVLTQVVKNAVIVPSGSKGGFVCLRSLPEREAMAHEAREQYCTLMRGLLDITDNLDGEDAPPEGVIRYDDFDPYLVVAADKGTAPFSDTANAVAAEYDFWLDDAFASGGSYGYDHKEVGITAKGAWESVKRHFQEMGRNIQKEPFTVAGIGDMSGDVFGNGMLLSRHTRLVAAFDHRHVFIDPDPDPEVSFAERERLFHLGRSSWDDYDRDKLSAGGMIVPRGVKSVDLTEEARAALGLDSDSATLDGESLIRAVLAAPVDLLWNGGIGTYVKADAESHADAGDASNDAVRVDVKDLRAKVVGEGGNLGFTQAARVEYALGGGRINTDALDNSGGVNLSDREVNLKILLKQAMNAGLVTREERNGLLERLTDTVAGLVVRDNETGCQAISLDEYRARRGMDHYWALMGDLSRIGLLDRDAEGLPSWDELTARKEANQSLTRPELSVLLSYAKLHLKAALLASDLPDDPSAENYFFGYFPPEAVETVPARAGGQSSPAPRNRRLPADQRPGRPHGLGVHRPPGARDRPGRRGDRARLAGRREADEARLAAGADPLPREQHVRRGDLPLDDGVGTCARADHPLGPRQLRPQGAHKLIDRRQPRRTGGAAGAVPRDRGRPGPRELPEPGGRAHAAGGRRNVRPQPRRPALPGPPARDPAPGPRQRHRPGKRGPHVLLGDRGAAHSLARGVHREDERRGQVAAALGARPDQRPGRDPPQSYRGGARRRGCAGGRPGVRRRRRPDGPVPSDPGGGGGGGADQPGGAVGGDSADSASGEVGGGYDRESSRRGCGPPRAR